MEEDEEEDGNVVINNKATGLAAGCEAQSVLSYRRKRQCKSCSNFYSSVRSLVRSLVVHVVRDGRASRYSRCVESTLSLASKLAGNSLSRHSHR